MINISVLGAGTWGTALAQLLAQDSKNNIKVTLWSAIGSEIDALGKTKKHPNLGGMVLSDEIALEKDLQSACRGAEIIILAVPSPFVRETAKKVAPFIEEGCIIVDVAKGLEAGSCKTLSEVISDELGEKKNVIVALSGPTHAEEVALGMPTAIVAASDDSAAAEKIQSIFSNGYFRVYTNPDIKGVEICGALKNIIALAAGLSAGLGYGDNAKAAIITRGIAEITRLGIAMGCPEATFSGLAGIGDLVVTCTSIHSRNNKAGYLMGKGMSAEEATKEVGMAIGKTDKVIYEGAMALSKKYGVDLPICSTLDLIVKGKLDAKDAISVLFARDLKSET